MRERARPLAIVLRTLVLLLAVAGTKGLLPNAAGAAAPPPAAPVRPAVRDSQIKLPEALETDPAVLFARIQALE